MKASDIYLNEEDAAVAKRKAERKVSDPVDKPDRILPAVAKLSEPPQKEEIDARKDVEVDLTVKQEAPGGAPGGGKEPTPEEAAQAKADEEIRAKLDKLAQDAWQKMKAAYDDGETTATLADGTVVKVADGQGKRGPCLSLVMDTVTGKVYYGQNTGRPPVDLSEPLGSRTVDVAAANQAASPAPSNYPTGWSRKAGIPGSHSEVQAASQALAARQGAPMGGLAVYNIRTEDMTQDVAPPMPCCVNCKPILSGARLLSEG